MGKPIKPPHCGYSLFSQQGLTRKEAMTEIGMKWKELNDEEKALYSLKAAEVTLIEEMEFDENCKNFVIIIDEHGLQKEICLLHCHSDPSTAKR
jgi:hypothetical protein